MFDEFHFPKAPRTPMVAIIVETKRKEATTFAPEGMVITPDHLNYPLDYDPIIALLPYVDLPLNYQKEERPYTAFIDQKGRVGIMAVATARLIYQTIFVGTATAEEHLANFAKYRGIKEMFEKAGWDLLEGKEIIDIFRDTNKTDHEFIAGREEVHYKFAGYDPVPKAIFGGFNRILCCHRCGHPMDTDVHAVEEAGCPACGAEFDAVYSLEALTEVMHFIGEGMMILDDEDGFPGLDKEEWT